MTFTLKAIALGAILSACAALSAGAATIFTDRASFDAATGALSLETFDNAIARAPMITFDGGITSSRSGTTNSPNEVNNVSGVDGSFAGFVGRNQRNLITFGFGTGITAFGADFSGVLNLRGELFGGDGTLVETVTIASGTAVSGFFGFTSDSPFTQLTFRTRDGDFGGQLFTLDDLATGDAAIAPVPLPAALPLLLAAFGGFAMLRRRKSA